MTQGEVMKLTTDMAKRWPHSATNMPSDSEYFEALQRFNAHQVKATVEALDADGVRFAPRGSEIVRKLAELYVDAPDWYAVLAEARARRASSGHRALATIDRVCPAGQCDGSGRVELNSEGGVVRSWETGERPATTADCMCREQLLREATARQSAHPVVAMFLTQIDQRELHDTLDRNTYAEHSLKSKYEDYTTNLLEQLTYSGIDPAGLPGLTRRQLERERTGELQRPDVRGAITDSSTEEAA